MLQKLTYKIILLYSVFFFLFSSVEGREIHVSKTGDDKNSGSIFSPLLTVNAAAQIALPGDSVIIHEGIYRERINPANGGSSETLRIIYTPYGKDKVVIKGSDRINNWTRINDNVWQIEINNKYFGAFNPYTQVLVGGFTYGGWQHLGNVYINDNTLIEQKSTSTVLNTFNTWCTGKSDSSVFILANFGNLNPNIELAEINVREAIFYPSQIGIINYITVSNLTMSQAATKWQSPQNGEQKAIIGTNAGHHWIISNCKISHSRCTGISLGSPTGGYKIRNHDYNNTGHHLIYNNTVIKCGEAGICGAGSYASVSKIYNNLIDSINYTNEFGGYEISGLKFHNSVDMEIFNNIVRNIGPAKNIPTGNGWGIWMDFCNQGTRVSGNIIYSCYNEGLMLECNLGPILIDNNICIGNTLSYGSKDHFFVHNLFVNGTLDSYNDNTRFLWYYIPHTILAQGLTSSGDTPPLAAGTIAATVTQNKFYNNIFIGKGFTSFKKFDGSISDKNIFYQGATRSVWGDANSIVNSSFNNGFNLKASANSCNISFNIDSLPFKIATPLISYDYLGIGPLSYPQQGIETADGVPIVVNKDIYGLIRNSNRPMPGPFETLTAGYNEFEFSAGITDSAVSMFPVLLPEAISTFSANISRCSVTLNWTSQTEDNIGEYQLQSSINNLNFFTRIVVPPKCTGVNACNYSFTLDQKDTPVAYYRLKIVYKDGHYEYTKINAIKSVCNAGYLNVFPNPAFSQLTINYYNASPSMLLNIHLMDIQGRAIYAEKKNAITGLNTMVINTQGIASGKYILRLETQDHAVQQLSHIIIAH